MAEAIKMEMAEGTIDTVAGERKNVIRLKKPYSFEGVKYQEIDLSGLDQLTVKDAVDAQRQLFGEGEIATATICETTTAFARTIAAKASGKPIEFFKMMPRSATALVSRTVRAHMNTENRTENHVLYLEQPYSFKGKEYTEIDLAGLADLTCMNESEAENRMAREGFMVVETSFNYLYACCIASMATGLPEEFFTGLPLRELLKLKNEVNSPDFFE